MVTVSAFFTEIVRVAEREPNKIGLQASYRDHEGNFCIIGKACDNLGFHCPNSHDIQGWNNVSDVRLDKVYQLNDQGIPWGQIPVRAGLVPGEDAGIKTIIKQPYVTTS